MIPVIDASFVRRLISSQFPKWKDLPIRPVPHESWDNNIFHLGENMLVRMPSGAAYAAQVEKEHKWLPKLTPSLPLPIPKPLAMGEPTADYPWKWSIYLWLEGRNAASAPINDLSAFATSLAQFLIALQDIDPTDGPLPGPHNFFRGGPLSTYDSETRKAITALKNKIDANTATEIWEKALATTWNHAPVWIHGDISADNLLVKDGNLSAVIDFGILGIGDSACDLAIAWTFFSGKNRETFREMLPLDADTWARGRAWTLWKAITIAAGHVDAIPREKERSWQIIDEVLTDPNG